MRSIRIIEFFALLALFAAAAATGRSSSQQDSQQPHQAQKPIQVQTTLVNLFATVRDSHHAVVPGLNQQDFHVFEDGAEQKIAFFSKEVNLPITLGLLIDTSLSEQENLVPEQEAATAFLREILRPKDLTMVMSFDQDVNLLADFTEDMEILEAAIHRTKINAPSENDISPSSGVVGTAFYDAVYLASHDQLSDQAGRKAIVVLTDADDNGSKMKVEDSISAAQRADAVIHVLLISDPHYGGANYGVAQKMTEETGGRVISVRGEKDLRKAFDQIIEELRSQYVLGYYPTNTARDGKFRKVKVETGDRGMKVLVRRGYYAPAQ